jgi:parallel beta-helix repeat protein
MNTPHLFHQKILCTGIILLSFSLPEAATYYVSNSGSDQNSGKTDSAAFATLAYARTKLAARDTLLLQRGDVFRDSLNLSNISDPAIGAYGIAALPLPVISGSVAITGWGVHQGKIWAAICDKKIEKLFVDNALMPLARYPDTGWLRIDTVTENSDGSNTAITVKALAQHPRTTANYWSNAQVRWRRWSWWFETRPITSSTTAGTLSLAGKSENHIMGDSGCKGWHFYIDNKFEELDAPGEWFYDSSARKVYFYPPGGVDPSSLLVEGATQPVGIVLAGGTVDNICLRHQTLYGLSLSKKSAITRCRFEGIGGDAGGAALRGSWDIADSRIRDNVFENNLNIGISWYENSGRKGQTFIQYDTLQNTGTFPGYGGTGSWHGVGILVHLSSNVQIQYNYIDKTGYAGILLGSDSNYVQYNIIKRAMWTLNDGGAIYTDCSRSTIRNNIIYDTRGDLSSSGPWYPLGHGIWLEFLGDYRESTVESNTIVRSGCNGIYLPNNFSCTIKNNVLFDNAEVQLDLGGLDTNEYIDPPRRQKLPQNNQFTGNICFATTRNQKALTFQSQFDYGTLQGNYFCNPYTDSVVSGYGTGNKRYTLYNYTLAQWRAQFAWADATSKTGPIRRPSGMSESKPYGNGAIFINESQDAQTFSLGSTTYQDLDGAPVSGSITVPPYYSKILVYSDSMLGTKTFHQPKEIYRFRLTRNVLYHTVPEKGRVTFSIYNQTGRRVFHLYEQHQKAGDHAIAFGVPGRTNHLSVTGIFVYRYSFSSEKHSTVRAGTLILVR